jgi:tetratricopeptide (TPR) repeat protein
VQEAWINARSLDEDPNQALVAIVAGYRRVLDLEPGHAGAATALAGLAAQWRESISMALSQGDFDEAETRLAESGAAFPNDPGMDSLRVALVNRRHADTLLASTQALLRSHGMSDIPSASAAIQTYREVLRLAPDHVAAREELDSLATHYAGLATEAAADGQIDNAINFLDRASAANAELPLLDDVRDHIRQATTLQAAIAEMLSQAGALRAQAQLINPPGENAAELYHRVLAADPDNAIATQGLQELESQILSNVTQLLALGQIIEVERLVDRSASVGLNPDVVGDMMTRLEAEVTRLDTVRQRLDDAASLLALGYVTAPPDGNAVALLRDVERLDPGNELARALLSQSAERLAAVAVEAWSVGLVDDAKQYLELALTVTPDVSAWRELRASWDEDDSSS